MACHRSIKRRLLNLRQKPLLHFEIQQIQRNVAKHPEAVWHENNQQPMKGQLQSQCKSMKDYLNINCTKHARRDGIPSAIMMHSRM